MIHVFTIVVHFLLLYFIKEKELLAGKSYCSTCAEGASECGTCHRPLPHRLVVDGLCIACKNKRERNRRSGLGGQAVTEEFSVLGSLDPLASLIRARRTIRKTLNGCTNEHQGTKWYATLHVTFVKRNNVGEDVEHETSFRGDVATLLFMDEFDEQYNAQVELITRRIIEFVQNGSGWSICSVDKIILSMATYNPTGESSFIRTPKSLINKKAIVNVQNGDVLCFIWAVLSALHPQQQNAERVTKYQPFKKELNVDGLEFPMKVCDVKKFEKINDTMSINVFAYDEKSGIYPVYVTAARNRLHHVNLLLLTEESMSHYTWIKDMSRLLHRSDQRNGQKHYCNYCLHGFCEEDVLKRHVDDCSNNGAQKVELPKEDDRWVQFKDIQKMLQVPFVIYADFEAYTCKLQGPANRHAATMPYELHELSGFAYHVVCADPARIYEPVVYRGPNVVDEFLARLKKESWAIHDILKDVVPMKLSEEEERSFRSADVCYLCEEPLGADRVRDHCHLTGKYRGAAHSECNLQLQYKSDKRNNRSVFYNNNRILIFFLQYFFFVRFTCTRSIV